MAATLLYRQLATDRSAVTKLRRDLLSLPPRMRDDKRPWREEALRYDNIWKGRHDNQSYLGRLQLYLPIGRRILENWVQKLKQDLFPRSGRWFEVGTSHVKQEPTIPILETLFTKFAREWVQLRRQASPYLRTLVTLGTAPVEIGWRVSERLAPTLVRDEETGEAIPQLEKLLDYLGPTWRQVDPYLFYVYPATVSNPWDARVLLEDALIEQAALRMMGDTDIDAAMPALGKRAVRVDKALQLLGQDGDTDKHEAEERRLQQRGFDVRRGRDPTRPLDVQKLYWKGDLGDKPLGPDGESELDIEGDAGERWYKVLVAGEDTVLSCRRVESWTGLPPYLCGKFVEVFGEFWGYGLPSVFDNLQYFTNDVLNQTGDGLVWSLNPIAALDQGAIQDPSSIRMLPGAKWLVREPAQNVKLLEPSKETAVVGMSAVQQLIALMNDVSNVAPFGGGGLNTGGRSRGRALQTAAGMQIVLSEALVQVADVIENQEDSVYNPMLRWWHTLTMQCLDRALTLRVEGRRGAGLVQAKVDAAMLVGDYEFRWLGSTHAFNMQVRAQQLLTAVQVFARIPAEVLAQQNAQIDWLYLVRQIWGEGFGMRDADRVIKEIRPTVSVDAKLENELFAVERGYEVEVSPGDNDLEHAKVHDEMLGDPRITPVAQQQLQQHVRAHMSAFVMKQMLQQQAQQQQALAQAAVPLAAILGGGGGGGGQRPPGQGPPNSGGEGRMPLAPGRTAATSSLDDVFRGLPRMGNGGPT